MKIGVCIKQTFDTEAQIALTAEGTICNEEIKKIINPYDEFAIEEGLRIKEQLGGEVICITVGGASNKDALKLALGMGCDKGILINDEGLARDEYATAALLAKVAEREGFQLILGGARSIDNASCQVLPRVAGRLGMAMVDLAVKVEITENSAVVTHDVEEGREVVEAALPLVVSTQKDLNVPRVATMKGLLQAKKKPTEEIQASALLEVGNKLLVSEYALPAERAAGRLVNGEPAELAAEIAAYLRNDAKII